MSTAIHVRGSNFTAKFRRKRQTFFGSNLFLTAKWNPPRLTSLLFYEGPIPAIVEAAKRSVTAHFR